MCAYCKPHFLAQKRTCCTFDTWRRDVRRHHSDNFTHPGASCFRCLCKSTRPSMNCHIPSQSVGDWSALIWSVSHLNSCARLQIICSCKVYCAPNLEKSVFLKRTTGINSAPFLLVQVLLKSKPMGFKYSWIYVPLYSCILPKCTVVFIVDMTGKTFVYTMWYFNHLNYKNS